MHCLWDLGWFNGTVGLEYRSFGLVIYWRPVLHIAPAIHFRGQVSSPCLIGARRDFILWIIYEGCWVKCLCLSVSFSLSLHLPLSLPPPPSLSSSVSLSLLGCWANARRSVEFCCMCTCVYVYMSAFVRICDGHLQPWRDFSVHCKCGKCRTFNDDSTYEALSVCAVFSDVDLVLQSLWHQAVESESVESSGWKRKSYFLFSFFVSPFSFVLSFYLWIRVMALLFSQS